MSGQFGEPIVRGDFPRFKLGERVSVAGSTRSSIVIGPHPENPAHAIVRSEVEGSVRAVRASDLRIMKARR